jgi:hypothetical protein
MSVPLGVVVSSDCAAARMALLDHDVENISELMVTLNAQASHMFQRAVQLPGLGAQQKFMLSKVLEARLVQRQIWKAAKAAAPSMNTQSLVHTARENLAQTANSIGVVLQLLQQHSFAKRWFQAAFDEAPREGIVHWYASMNLTAVRNMEASLSGSATPEHVEGAAEASGAAEAGAAGAGAAEAGAADGLGGLDASLVLSTDAVLTRVVAVLEALHGEAVSAHYITE